MRLIVSSRRFPNEHYGSDALLLGEWCVAGDVTASIIATGARVLDHPWIDNGRLQKDYLRIREIYYRALDSLSAHLSVVHGVTLSRRGWEIFVGPWLSDFITCVFERHMLLDAAVSQHGATTLLRGPQVARREPQTTSDSKVLIQDPAWNETLCEDIARLAFPSLNTSHVELLDDAAEPSALTRGASPWGKSLARGRLLALIKSLDARMHREARIVLHRTGLSWQRELQLMLRSGMLPHFFLPALEQVACDRDESRRAISFDGGSDGTGRIVGEILGHYLPRSYIEDFAAAAALVRQKYPRRPQRIITGVAYYADDCFKLFTALALERGAEYVILQHGGAFGSTQLNDHEELQLRTADYFLSWGWSTPRNASCRAEVIGAPAIVLSMLRDVQADPTGGIVLPVSEWALHTFRLYSAPLSFRQLRYLDEIVTFYRHLSPSARRLLRLRLQSNRRGWRCEERLAAAGLDAAILRNPGRFVDDLAASRLAVVNTNSTSILEALALNFPTVLLMDEELWPIRPEARGDYEELKRAGILYTDPVRAARHVSQIHEDVARWWRADLLQRARRSFVDRHARRDTTMPKRLKRLFAEPIANHRATVRQVES